MDAPDLKYIANLSPKDLTDIKTKHPFPGYKKQEKYDRFVPCSFKRTGTGSK